MCVVIQDNLSSEKHIDRIFSDTVMMLKNIWMAFHFLDKDMMRKIITIQWSDQNCNIQK